MAWRIRYFPVEAGETQQIFPISVTNWKNNAVIKCFGECDIPSIDMTPEVIFPFVSTASPFLSPQISAYFSSEGAYNFGIIVTPNLSSTNVR